MPRIFSLIVLLLLAISMLGCEQQSTDEQSMGDTSSIDTDQLIIYTVNYPLQYFAARIGGDLVDARYPGPANTDPAYWQPDTEDILTYQQADLIVLNGAGYAGWTKLASLPLGKQLDSSSAVADRLLPLADKVAHTHGPTGRHVHDDLAFTLWLDPELAAAQAIAIHERLAMLLPEHAETLSNNLAALTADLWELHSELENEFAVFMPVPVIYSHPVYQYLDRRYELNGTSLHWEPDEAPPARELAGLEDMSGGLLLWEAKPLADTTSQLQERGIRSVVLETCATQPANGDYLDCMRNNLQRLRSALP